MKSGTGPALASVGPDMKHFAGPHSAACAKVMEEGHQIIMIEIMSDVKERGPKRLCQPGGVWELACSVSPLQQRLFLSVPYGHLRST